MIKEDRDAIKMIDEALFESVDWPHVYDRILRLLLQKAKSCEESMQMEIDDGNTHADSQMQLAHARVHVKLLKFLLETKM